MLNISLYIVGHEPCRFCRASATVSEREPARPKNSTFQLERRYVDSSPRQFPARSVKSVAPLQQLISINHELLKVHAYVLKHRYIGPLLIDSV